MVEYTPDAYEGEQERIASVINGRLELSNLGGEVVEVLPVRDANGNADPQVDIVVRHNLGQKPYYIIPVWNPQGSIYGHPEEQITNQTITFRISGLGLKPLRFLLLPETL